MVNSYVGQELQLVCSAVELVLKYKIKPTGITTNILNVEFGLFKDKFGYVLNLVNTPQNTLAFCFQHRNSFILCGT